MILMNSEQCYDTVIIGSGAAGLTAAIYAARDGLETLILGGQVEGGQLSQTTDVENFPGFPKGISGMELMSRARQQAERFGADIQPELAVELQLESYPYTVKTTGGEKLKTRTIIIASGASAIWLGLDSEIKYRGNGVSACATCDGFFYREAEVLVVGGGDAAAEEALFLTRFARRVRIVHRRDRLRCSPALSSRLENHTKIEILWNSELIEVLGDNDKVTGAKIITHPEGHPGAQLKQDPGGVEEKTVECAGIFIAIGHSPNTDFLDSELIPLDKNGYVATERSVFTPIDGVYAAGDVADRRYQQAITAAGSGCKAALEVERFLNQEE